MGTPIFEEEYNEILKQINDLKEESRQISEEIAQARDLGDLSENAEYHAARERKAFLEAKIASLGSKIAGAEIVKEDDIQKDVVGFGCKVKLLNIDTNDKLEYTIVSSGNADFDKNEITITSPVARGLQGHKKGDVVEVQIPAGTFKYKIEDIL